MFLWSDSKVTLSWVSSEKEQKDVYVANRVSEIQQHVIALGINCMYVPTADLVSRGSTVDKLKRSNWLNGPDWLVTNQYPDQSNVQICLK